MPRWLKIITILLVLSNLIIEVFLVQAETKTRQGQVELSATVSQMKWIMPVINPLKIYDVKISDITDQSAKISWQTDQPATSVIWYGRNLDYEIGEISDLVLKTRHEIKVIGLEPETVYNFQTRGRSLIGAESFTGNYSFQTLKDTTPPANVSEFQAQGLEYKIQLTWKNPPDKDFKAVKILRSEKFFPLSSEEGTLIYDGSEESFLDKNLEGGATYYYTAFAYDFAGNFASGASARALVLPLPLPPLPTPPPPLPVLPLPPVEIEVLQFPDFYFQVAQNTIRVMPNAVNILSLLPGTILNISIETVKYPKVLKTIMVVIEDLEPEKSRVYLLRSDEKGEIYEGSVVVPLDPALYNFQIVNLNYAAGTFDRVQGKLLIEPFGAIKAAKIDVPKNRANNIVQAAQIENPPLYLAKVTLYEYNENGKNWQVWQGLKYSQRNPIYSNPQGYYGFLLPKGKYYLDVAKENYLPHKTLSFQVDEKNFVNQEILLKKIILSKTVLQIFWSRLILLIVTLIISFGTVAIIKHRPIAK